MDYLFATFDLDLIRSRIELLGLDYFIFIQRTGLTLTNLQSELRPELINAEKLVQIAHMLDLDISEMIVVSRDDPQSEIAPSRSSLLPATPTAAEGSGDAVFLRAVLTEHEFFRLDELADILIWTRQRLLEAIETLQRQLINTSQNLICVADSVKLFHDPTIGAPTVRQNLFTWRKERLQLTPHEAQYLLHLVRNAIVAPLALITSRRSHDALWLARENELHDRHLIRISTHGNNTVASAHPDVLFGLRLISNPSSPDES